MAANRLIWVGNVLLIGALAAFGVHAFLLFTPAPLDVDAPQAVPQFPRPGDEVNLAPLWELRNPLKHCFTPAQDEPVYLIGTLADTAYLFLVRRQAYVNAYLDEPLPIAELEGWKLRRVSTNTASFSTPLGEQVLLLQAGPAGVAGRIDDRPRYHVGVELLKTGKLEEAIANFEKELEGKSSEEVYRFVMEIGEDIVASLMNSKNEKAREFGFRLFERAKQGGDRRRL